MTWRERTEAYFKGLQERICGTLAALDGQSFREDLWSREGGGGGRTRVIENGGVFEKAGVNFSSVSGDLPQEFADKIPRGNGTAFFATGYFSGFGAVSAELYPTSIRATAQGLTYNIGRVASAVAPWIVGGAADVGGYGSALSMTAIAFIVAAALWVFIPETKGRALVQ